MVKFTQKQGPCITTFPIYFLCPYCDKQLALFHTNPVLCSYCSQRLRIKYKDLCKSSEYKVQYHFNRNLPF